MQRASLASLHRAHNGSHGLDDLLSYNPRALMLRLLFLPLALSLIGCVSVGNSAMPLATQTLLPRSLPAATATAEPNKAVAPVETIGPSPTPLVHEIVEGDTLLSIAIQYGVELADLLLANSGVNPRLLVIGESLNIPSSGAQRPVPTATPAPVSLSEVACYEMGTGGFICLLTASVSNDEATEGVIALVTLADSGGNALQTEPAYGPINLVLPSRRIPLIAFFDQSSPDFKFASATAISALHASNIDTRYAELDLQIQSSEIESDGKSGTIAGRVELLSDDLDPSDVIRLVAVAFGQNEVPVGFRTYEFAVDTGSYDFEITVFSLGPSIERIEILSEAPYLP